MEIMVEIECFGIGVYNIIFVSGNCYIFSMFSRKIFFFIFIYCEREGIVVLAFLEYFEFLRASSFDFVDMLLCFYFFEMVLVI